MLSLRETQERMTAAILTGGSDCHDYVSANGIPGARRIQVYRNNRLSSLTEALLACYPAVARLVGTEFFDHAARGYIQSTPLRCANLHYFGQGFADYLQRGSELTAWPFVPGIARLEWACQEVLHAQVSPPLNLTRLRRVPERAYPGLRLNLNAATRLLRSNYPLLRIWQVNQPGYAGEDTVSLDDGGIRLLIARSALGPQFLPLTDGEYVFLRALSKGRGLQQACESALAGEAGFNLGATLLKHVSLGTLVEFSLPKSND